MAKRRDGFRCVKCGQRIRLEVDHVLPVRDRPDLAFDLSNLQTLTLEGPYRITASVGGGDVPAAVSEAFRRLADVDGTDLLTRQAMAMLGRSAALRGEAVLLIRDRLIPCADWDLSTRDGIPRAYRVSISEAGGGRTETVLAGEVIHLRLAADPVAP